MNLVKKIAASAIVASFALVFLVADADASTINAIIRGNGARSRNSINIRVSAGRPRRRRRRIRQVNNAVINNGIVVVSNTGFNAIVGTTGGSGNINTGDNRVTVNVDTRVNF